MTTYWFPDNTVLCNFAIINGLPLLRKILDERGRWVDAVADEARRSASFIPDLANIHREGWLGEPISMDDPDEIHQVDRTRRAVFGGNSHEPRKHLGEAQTLFIIKNWASFQGSHWITDDNEAFEFAKFQGITTKRTADLISEAVQYCYLSRTSGYGVLEKMVNAGRSLWVPPTADDL